MGPRLRTWVGLVGLLAVAGSTLAAKPAAKHQPKPPNEEAGDAVVVAVIDWEPFDPYLWDLRADLMPQHRDKRKDNDLPLDRPPHEWLLGFPNPADTFASYQDVRLTLPRLPNGTAQDVGPERWGEGYAADARAGRWDVPTSAWDSVHYRWLPGTKVVGAISFGSDGLVQGPKTRPRQLPEGVPAEISQGLPREQVYRDDVRGSERSAGGSDWHSVVMTSASVGTQHGACPECLLLFVEVDTADRVATRQAFEWVTTQPWVDAVVNAYGFGISRWDHGRDRISAALDTDAQRAAVLRGQAQFASAGNGLYAFAAPNTTYFSAFAGPDWVITVGGVDGDDSYPFATTVSAGAPADIATAMSAVDSAYDSTTVGGSDQIQGTSLAVAAVGGLYGRALYTARAVLGGHSRTQQAGVVATGRPLKCGGARPDCELADGILTRDELTRRLLHAVEPIGDDPADVEHDVNQHLQQRAPGHAVDVSRERDLMREGHGSFRLGTVAGRPEPLRWELEQDPRRRDEDHARIVGPLLGEMEAAARSPLERDWMLVDSYCRQKLWGAWDGGYYREGVTPLPADDPAWPVRTSLANACRQLRDGDGRRIGHVGDVLSNALWGLVGDDRGSYNALPSELQPGSAPATACTTPPSAYRSPGTWTHPGPKRFGNVVVNDPLYERQWGLDLINVEAAWRAGGSGRGVSIAFVDTGVDASHPELAPALDVLDDPYADLNPGVSRPCRGHDESVHGTPIAGIAVARAGNGTGLVGVAPEARLLSYRTDLTGTPTNDRAAIVEAIYRAIRDDAHVINLSFGSAFGDRAARARGGFQEFDGAPDPSTLLVWSSQEVAALDAALDAAADAGIVVVAGAGNNDQPGGGHPGCWYPARHPAVICVSGVDRRGVPGTASSFPVREPGDLASGAPGLALRAPGYGQSTWSSIALDQSDNCAAIDDATFDEGVWTTAPVLPEVRLPIVGPAFCPEEGYRRSVGTSLAAPFVSGVAALLLSIGLDRDGVHDCLRRYSSKLGTYDPIWGYGLVDAGSAVEAAQMGACG